MLKFLIDPEQNEISRLEADFHRRSIKFKKTDSRSIWWYFWTNRQYRTLLLYRLAKSVRSSFLKDIFWRLYSKSTLTSGLEINTPKLGGGVILPHWGRIILNAEEIGDNLYCFHNVTVGNDYRTGIPKIGNNVIIGTGSVILGKITIGDNVVIGASSLVNKDVLSNSVAAGNPAKIIKNIDAGYIKDMLGY